MIMYNVIYIYYVITYKCDVSNVNNSCYIQAFVHIRTSHVQQSTLRNTALGTCNDCNMRDFIDTAKQYQ